ncbi:MAG: hypothetical protein PHY08_04525 [Candidatus Cloacimonetes bacterium]|nr:hypothetical protein [Candidatus Cloacimonadota bacterium]
MRKYIISILISIISLNLFSTMTVSNLRVEDNPYDDGSGLIIKFQPLPKTARIIEYRFYRGTTPDSLFFLGKIDVDANTGISGNEVQFFDKDFRTLVNLEAPRHIKKEKGQSKNSPIYRAIPRDIEILGPMLKKYSILSVIDKNIFYHKSKKYIVENDSEKNLYGGLRIEDFDEILANVLPGEKFYYTVIAVDETRTFHKYAPITYGISVDNKPQKVNKFNVNWLEDSQILKTEFELPLFVDDIAEFSMYMINKNKINEYNNYFQYMEDLEQWNFQYTQGDTTVNQPTTMENPGTLISKIESSYPYPSVTFSEITYQDGFLINPYNNEKIEFNPENIKDYLFYISLDDYAGFQSLSDTKTASISQSNELPYLPSFLVRDKPYDKGDINEIIIGRPYSSITQINFRGHGKNKQKLTVAYNYSPNPNYKIKSINFEFIDNQGKTFANVTEYYIDYLFNLNLPNTDLIETGFSVNITFNAPNTPIHKEHYLSQKIYFDEDLKQLRPDNLYAGDENLLEFRYLIMKKAIADKNFRLLSKITPLINLLDDNVSYEKYIFKGIDSYNLKHNHLLIDTSVDIGYDEESKTNLSTNIFYNDFVEITKHKINQLKEKLSENPNDETNNYYLEYYTKNLEQQENNPILKKINSIKNHNTRLKNLIQIREYRKRAFKYYLVKTNNQGLFTASDIYTNENSEEYIFPTPDWFNITTIPMLIASLIFGIFVFYFYQISRRGNPLFIRPIAGLEEIDNAIGRATEMGKPILFVPGLSSIGDVATLAGLSILGHITKKAAEYDTRIIVPVCDYIVLPIAQQIVKEAHYAAGRPDSFNSNDIFFVAEGQFAYVAGVNGVMIRQKTATNFYMGMFYAEALIMTETGNATGAIQVAGTDALTQIPFFITTCDYTLIGEELYAASAYLTRDPMMIGTLKSQDYTKLLIILCIIVGTFLSSINITGFINWFPSE